MTFHAAFPVPLQFVSCQLQRRSTSCLNVGPCSMLDSILGSILTAFQILRVLNADPMFKVFRLYVGSPLDNSNRRHRTKFIWNETLYKLVNTVLPTALMYYQYMTFYTSVLVPPLHTKRMYCFSEFILDRSLAKDVIIFHCSTFPLRFYHESYLCVTAFRLGDMSQKNTTRMRAWPRVDGVILDYCQSAVSASVPLPYYQ